MKRETQTARTREELRREEVEIQMTPMVDIVFQLLIFFMLACRFRTMEGKLQCYLPKNRGLGVTPIEGITIHKVRVKLLWCEMDSLRETNDPYCGRVIMKVGDEIYPYVHDSHGNLIPDYDKLLEMLKVAKGLYVPRLEQYPALPVIIDAREQVPWEHVVFALNTCVLADIKDITFAAPAKPY